MIILKEAMNMNAAQYCINNVFAFPSKREYPKIVYEGYLSKDPNRRQLSFKMNINDHNQKVKEEFINLQVCP